MNGERDGATGLVVDDLHGAVLFDPQFADDDVVDAAVDVGPRVRLVPPRETNPKPFSM